MALFECFPGFLTGVAATAGVAASSALGLGLANESQRTGP